MIVFICSRPLTFASVQMLLLSTIYDLVPLIVLMSERVVSWGRLLLFVRAYVPNIIKKMRVIDRTRGFVSLRWYWVTSRSNAKRRFVVRTGPFFHFLLVLNRSNGFAPDSLVFLKEPRLLSHGGFETFVPLIWWRNIVDSPRRMLSLMKLYQLELPFLPLQILVLEGWEGDCW